MALKECFISKRYGLDALAIYGLNRIQRRWLDAFLRDPSIRFEEIQSCCLCGCEDAVLVAEKDASGIPLDTVVCEDCGLIRTYEQLTEPSLKIFYKKYYRNIGDDPRNHEKEIIGRYKQEESAYIPRCLSKKDIIVEIGCGGGWKLIPYRMKGFTYYGFDFDESFIELGRKYGLNLYTGGIQEACLMGIKAAFK